MIEGPAVEDAAIEQAARRVAQARLDRTMVDIMKDINLNDVTSGYRVMRAANDLLQERLGPVAGFKIGATAAHMRSHLGVASPVFGEVFASTVQLLSGQVSLERYRRLGIETEIAVILAHDLRADAAPWDRAQLESAIESVHPCIELVDDRYADFRAIGVATLVADNFFNAGCALGRPRRLSDIADIGRLSARTILAGQEVAAGTSDALFGHPLDALAWFANRRAAMGLDTPSDVMVTLGSITPSFWVDQPMTVRIEIESLGAVNLHVAAG